MSKLIEATHLNRKYKIKEKFNSALCKDEKQLYFYPSAESLLEENRKLKTRIVTVNGNFVTERSKKGIFDERNKLNDLTGKEWVYFLSSVEPTAYSTKGLEAYGHNLRKKHPSPKPPQLMRKIIEFFTKRGQWVLDPFAGVGGTLLGCSLCDRHAVGIDLSREYVEIYKKVCKQEGIQEQIMIRGDANRITDYPEIYKRKFDLILTDPPYCDMMARQQNGEKRKKTGNGKPTPFTNMKEDLGNLDYFNFLYKLREIIEISLKHLNDKKYLVLFTKDMQPTSQHHNMLHGDIVNELLKIKGLSFRGYKIWYDKTATLYPFGYPFSFVANQVHQYILVFRKEF